MSFGFWQSCKWGCGFVFNNACNWIGFLRSDLFYHEQNFYVYCHGEDRR